MEKLVEGILAGYDEIKEIQNEKLDEAIKENQDISLGYVVPIWRLDVANLNGRIYTTELAERIVKKNKVTYCLNSHEADEVYENVKAIAKNPKIENGILFVELYFVDREFGEKAKLIIEHGGDLGLSSVGYGELDKENKIVVETYQLERYCDFVFYPSYAVYINDNNEVIGEEIINDSETSTEDLEETATADNIVSDAELQTIIEIHEIKKLRR